MGRLRLQIEGYLYGNTYQGNLLLGTQAPKLVTFHVVRDAARALRLENTFKSMTHTSIQEHFHVRRFNQDTIFIGSKVFEGMTFSEWVNIKRPDNLESDKWANIVGLGPHTKNVLKQIVRALQSIHDGGAYHGRIEDAIRIGKDDGKVFAASSVAYREDAIENGVETDMNDFSMMVERVVNHNIRSGQQKPQAIDLFHKLYRELFITNPQAHQWRDRCFFIYSSPMLFYSEERLAFKHKVINIRNRNKTAFRGSCSFTTNPIDMTGWDQRITINGPTRTSSNPDYTPEFRVLCHPLRPDQHLNQPLNNQQ